MNDKQITLFRRFVVMQQNHWALYTILYLMMIFSAIKEQAEAPRIIMWLIIGFIPFLLCLVRNYLNKFPIFWGTHILMIVAVLLLPEPNWLYKLIFSGMGIFYCVNSILKRDKKDDMEHMVPIAVPVAVIFIAMISFEFLKNYDYQRNYIYLFILNLVLFFIAKFVDRFWEYLRVNRHSVGYMPVKSIFLEDVKAIVFFLVVMSIFFLLILHFEDMNRLMKYVTHYLGIAATAIVKFLLDMFKRNRMEESVTDEDESSTSVVENIVQQTQDNPIANIILFILVILAVAYVLFKIISILPMLLKLFRLPKESEEEQEETEDVLEISENIRSNRKKSFRLFQTLSPEERIRRRFKKKIQTSQEFISSEGRRTEMELYTARECSDILEVDEIGDIYEKARYSPYECTAEDVKNMKNACTLVRKGVGKN